MSLCLGEPLKGFAKDRKELILQYLSGLASSSQSSDQRVVENFLQVCQPSPHRQKEGNF